jgi:hypothetical protein
LKRLDEVTRGYPSERLEWNSPGRVVAFERDRVSVELLNVAFRVRLYVHNALNAGGNDMFRAPVTWKSRHVQRGALSGDASASGTQ